MIILILHLVISALAILITSKLVAGFKVSGFLAACLAAVVIGLANYFLWPLLFFLALPLTILTMGLFTFVVNGAVLKICAAVLPGFKIESWLAAIFGSVVLSILNYGLRWMLTMSALGLRLDF